MTSPRIPSYFPKPTQKASMNSIEAQIAAANAPFVPAVAPVVDLTAPPVPTGFVPSLNPGPVVSAGPTTIPVPTPTLAPTEAPTRAQTLQKTLAAECEKRDAAIKRIATIEAQLASVDRLDGVMAGSELQVKLGRADTAREVRAVVTGVKTEANGSKKFKLLVGSGFDATVEVINEGQIIAVLS